MESPNASAPLDPERRPADEPALVVGVGASADEIDALSTLLARIPAGAGLGFVVVFKDELGAGPLRAADLVRDGSSIEFVDAIDGQRIGPNRVHVAPCGVLVGLQDGVVRLVPAESPENRAAAIDRFLLSLARACGDRAVAVILSGPGSDGALGLKAVSDAGGMTMVQAPETARRSGMPQNALDTGAVDHVLPPEAMAAELAAYARHVGGAGRRPGRSLFDDVAEVMPQVCDVLLAQTGHDFHHYKISTLVRRTVRRVQVLRVPSARDYLALLRRNGTETQQLFQDLLIGVTALFRDADAFAALADRVVPRLLEGRDPRDPIRIWAPGCATGEEAYSLAMLFLERLPAPPHGPDVHIFATDIDEEAVQTARRGAYPLGVADELTPERLKRFFFKKGHQYHVARELRDRCLFSVHSLIHDPPFSRLDLISCRNVLIYLGPHLQQKLIPLFHYALRPGGFLFLGPSESIEAHRELFRPVDARHRISQRLPTAIRAGAFHGGDRPAVATPARPPNAPSAGDAETYLVMQRIVLDEFAPKSVVVDVDGQVVCASGNLEKYLTLGGGAFQNSITRLAREGLRIGVRAALSEAAKQRRKVSHDGLSLRTEAGLQRVMVTVQPMPQMGDEDPLFLVVFHDVGLPVAAKEDPAPLDEAASLIEQIERDLEQTRTQLERTVQDLEAANEELKSSNEELLSMNEELQSANEELETSKEEVQAANESLARLNTDLENLLSSTQIATIFLDRAGQLRWISPAVRRIYNVRSADVGRPLLDLTPRAEHMPRIPSFEEVCGGGSFEDEVELDDGGVFLRRVVPYCTPEGAAEGVVVTFVDVTERKKAARRLAESEERLRLAVAAAGLGIWSWNAATNEVILSDDARTLFGLDPEAPASRDAIRALMPDDERPVLAAAVDRALAERDDFAMEYRIRRGGSGELAWVFSSGRGVYDDRGRVLGMIGVLLDVTARKLAEEKLKASERLYRSIGESIEFGVWVTDPSGRNLYSSESYLRLIGLTQEQISASDWSDFVHPDDLPRSRAAWLESMRTGKPIDNEYRARGVDGRWRHILARGVPVLDERGETVCWAGINLDVERQKQAENAVRASEAKFRNMADSAPVMIWVSDVHKRRCWFNRPWLEFRGRTHDQEWGEGWAEGVHPEDRAHVLQTYGDNFDRRTPYRMSYRLRRVDGEYRWVVSTGCPMLDESGAFAGYVGSCLDVHDQRRAELSVERLNEVLASRVRELQTIYDVAPMGIHIAEDATCKVITSNRMGAEMLGMDPVSNLSKSQDDPERVPFRVLREGEEVPADELPMQRAVRGESVREEIFEILRGDGRRLEVMMNAEPLWNEAGVPEGAVGACIDVTALRESERALKEDDRRKNEFLAMLAHELRNPLAAITNAIVLGRLPNVDAETADWARGVIERQTKQLTRLVDDLMDVSRITRGKIHLRIEPVDAAQALRRAVEVVRPSVERKKQSLLAPDPAQSMPVMADPTRLEQIYVNVLNNASKYTDEGGRIEVEASPERGRAVVRVRDSGIGIEPEMLQSIFEPFSQVDASLDRSQGGLGIGLTLVKRLVEMHDGAVSVASGGRGLGSEFTVALPLRYEDAPPHGRDARGAPPHDIGFAPRRILVVDDNVDLARGLAELLQTAGHEVRTAHDGPGALAAAREFLPDVVLLDLGLPVMNGYEVAATLRREPCGCTPVLVAVSGYGQERDRERAHLAGFDHHVLKPPDPEILLDVVSGAARHGTPPAARRLLP